MQALVARVRNLLLNPRAEWDAIGVEPVEPGKLLVRYVAPLAAIPTVGTFLGLAVIGVNVAGEQHRAPWLATAASALVFFLLTAVAVYSFAWIIAQLAPRFGGSGEFRQAFKLSAYSLTAALLAGVVTVVPALGVFALLGASYSLYLLFIGAPRVMVPPAENATNFAIVATMSAIVLALAVGLVVMATAAAAPGGLFPRLSQASDFRLSGFAETAAAANAEATAPAAPALRGVGASFAGAGALKDIPPQRLAGLERLAVGALASGPDSARVLTVDAEYRRGDRYIVLQITYSPTIAEQIGFGGAATSEFDRETPDGYSRRKRESGAIVVEDWNKASRSGSYGRLLGDRLYVRAVGGGGVRPSDLKQAAEAFGIELLQRFEQGN